MRYEAEVSGTNGGIAHETFRDGRLLSLGDGQSAVQSPGAVRCGEPEPSVGLHSGFGAGGLGWGAGLGSWAGEHNAIS